MAARRRQVSQTGRVCHLLLPHLRWVVRASTTTATSGGRWNHVVLKPVDVDALEPGRGRERFTGYDLQVRDLAGFDAAELRIHAGDFGGADGERLERDLARKSRGDRLAHVVHERVRGQSA